MSYRLSRFLFVTAAALLCASLSWAAPHAAPSPYEGKIIRQVRLELNDIFEDPQDNSLFTTINSLKISTKQHIVMRELLFKAGDPYQQTRIDESERALRLLKYLRNISITAQPVGNEVDIVVHAQDTWTMLPQFGYSSGTGTSSRSAALVDSDLLGYGKRLELGYTQKGNRDVTSAIYEDNRFLDSKERLFLGRLERNDGHESLLYFGSPFRTLFDPESWYINFNQSDLVGRLFKNAEEDYIFERKDLELNLRYVMARGNVDQTVWRYVAGVDILKNNFSQATANDYSNLNLDPTKVSNDPSRLAPDRHYYGAVLGLQSIEPDYITMNYIDRFDRAEDYNLGAQYDISGTFAPAFTGSTRDTFLFSANKSAGHRFSRENFVRGEAGLSTRYDSSGFANTLLRFEAKYYDVLGSVYLGDLFLGRHTLAASWFLDYGHDIDPDRQFDLGADNALRGYPARTFVGDKRSALNLEDRVHLVDNVYDLISIGAAAFFDAGSASYRPLGDLYSRRLYADVGCGLRVAFPRSSGGQVLRLDLAMPLRSADDGTNSLEFRIILSGGQLFSSHLRSETLGPERANVSIGFDH